MLSPLPHFPFFPLSIKSRSGPTLAETSPVTSQLSNPTDHFSIYMEWLLICNNTQTLFPPVKINLFPRFMRVLAQNTRDRVFSSQESGPTCFSCSLFSSLKDKWLPALVLCWVQELLSRLENPVPPL